MLPELLACMNVKEHEGHIQVCGTQLGASPIGAKGLREFLFLSDAKGDNSTPARN